MNVVYFTKLYPVRMSSALFEKSYSMIETLANEDFHVTLCSSDPKINNKNHIQQYPITVVDISEKRILNSLTAARVKPEIAIFDSPETQYQYSAFLYNKWNKCPRVLQINEFRLLQNWRKNNYKSAIKDVLIPYNSPMVPNNLEEILTTE